MGLLPRRGLMVQYTILTKCVGRDLCDHNGLLILRAGKTAEARVAG